MFVFHPRNNVSAEIVWIRDDCKILVCTFFDGNIKFIYDAGLENIISIASVDPKDKVATTWGTIKSQR